MTRSADLLLIPGIGRALNTSIETIKIQLEERGHNFFQRYEDPSNWTVGQLQRESVHCAGVYRVHESDVVVINKVCLPGKPAIENWSPRQESLLDILDTKRSSSILAMGEDQVITVYKVLSDSAVAMTIYPVSAKVLEAKNEINRAYDIYSTLTLLKESIIQKHLIWALAVLLVVGLAILSIITARKLSTGISEPIQDLVTGMTRVANGDLSHRVDTRARDEFQFLVASFNTMTRDLDVSRQKLIKAERLATWQEVARRISHEIKNSLTPISISLRRFRNHFTDKPLPTNISDSLLAIDDELRSLESMARSFSEFARMPQPDKIRLDLNRIVQSVVRLMEPVAGHVTIEMDLHEDLPLIDADREQMKRLLNNLIKNGIEASHDTGSVTVSTRRANEGERQIEIEVRDEGEGIDNETVDRIFRPYYTTKKKGTGLGLALVQKIVDDHDGEIQVTSEMGHGTRVTVRL